MITATHNPPDLFTPPLGRGGMLIPALGPLLHFVRWSPRERLAFLPAGRSAVAIEVTVAPGAGRGGAEWCPICRAPICHPAGAAQDDPRARFRPALTPSWCCLREVPR